MLPVHNISMQGFTELSARSGVRADEAVALLRRFYAQENQSAPVPQKRTKKQKQLGESEEAAAGAESSEAAARTE